MSQTYRWTLGSLLLALTLFGAAARGDWKAGVAKIKITPQQSMWMSGYSARVRPSEGHLADLWAKALVLEDGDGDRAVLITLDLIGLDHALSTAICADLKQSFGFDRQQVALCCSHTHSGPVVGRNLAPLHYLVLDENQQGLIDAYAESLQKDLHQLVQQALENLEACELTWGSGSASFAVNRRNNPAPNVPALRVQGGLVGPADHDVPVLAVRGTDGTLKAVTFGYACHATVLMRYEWSGDYPGFAQAALEQNHPGCTALFWAGCGADQNPLPRRSVELAKHYGQRLATAVDAVLLTSQMAPVADRLTTRFREVDLQFDALPSREELERDAQGSNKYAAARARLLLEQLNTGQPLSPSYPYPIGVWRLGENIQFVTLGGEVVVDFAIRLKAESLGTGTWVAGYANDVMAYIPSRRVLREGGYEGASAMVYYGLPTQWAPEVEQTIIDEVHRQLEASE